MPNFLVEFLMDVVASQSEDNEWHRHLVEELEGLKQLVERGAGASGSMARGELGASSASP